MVESEPVPPVKQPTQDSQSLQQPKDAVPMENMDKKEGTDKVPEAGASIAIASHGKDASPATDTKPETQAVAPEPSAEDALLKGKEKEQSTAPTGTETPKDEEDDSLQIQASVPAGTSSDIPPVCNITLLLPTGARHPYRIDEKYLAKRGVEIPETNEAGHPDPFSVSIYKLKELILREWRDEWDGKPASPSSIRLIHFGKLLEDKEQLKKYQFSTDNPNVVHMSVKPAEMLEEDEAGKSSGREGRTREGGGGCCVIL